MPRTIAVALGSPTKGQLRLLCTSLWSWQFCENCQRNTQCLLGPCPNQRLALLTPFFRHYKILVDGYRPDLEPGYVPAIQSHEDVAGLLDLIKSEPWTIRSSIRERVIKINDPRKLCHADVDAALDLVVRMMCMISCCAESLTPGMLEQGPDRVCWRDSDSLCSLVGDAFELTDNPLFGHRARDAPRDARHQLKATKLKKRAKISFVPTSDIRSHLRYDRRTNTVELFHHLALLKEHLRITKDQGGIMSAGQALQCGSLPRQVALEVVDSIQQLLFPLTDPKSFSMLRSLVSKHTLDPDCLRFDSVAIRHDHETDIPYLHFGSRLADLYEELQNPHPQGNFEKWLERRSGARYVMLATLVGVVIAILLGFASLVVSVFQAYVSYQAWQHPVLNS